MKDSNPVPRPDPCPRCTARRGWERCPWSMCPMVAQLAAALEALTERAFRRCLFPAEVKAAFGALEVKMSDRTTMTPTEVIVRIAEVAAAVGWQAGIGASELAGTIISVLAANPQLVERFLADGMGVFIDGPTNLDAVNGCLTYLAQTGEILSPGELHRRRGGSAH